MEIPIFSHIDHKILCPSDILSQILYKLHFAVLITNYDGDGGAGDGDGDDDDLYIIGAVCLFVTKVIISVFKGFGRFRRL